MTASRYPFMADKPTVKSNLLTFKINQPSKVTVNLLIQPEDLPSGRQSHHSKFELFTSDLIETAPIENILCQIIKVDFGTFIATALPRPSNLFFSRQFLNAEKVLEPSLPPSCICKSKVNPDKPLIVCSQCSAFYHLACVASKPKCETCSANLISSHLGKKRERLDFDVPKPIKKTSETIKWPSLSIKSNRALDSFLKTRSLIPSEEGTNAQNKLRANYKERLAEILVFF